MRASRLKSAKTAALPVYSSPPEALEHLETKWLERKGLYRALRTIRQSWYRPDLVPLLEPLDMILWEVAGAQGLYHPFPDVVVATHRDQAVGVLSGHGNWLHRCYFITSVALHPGFSVIESDTYEIAKALLEAAMDLSLQLGFHGWVGCDSDLEQLPLLKSFGFTEHDDFTHRKMGYFS